jgi:hypothetical protein
MTTPEKPSDNKNDLLELLKKMWLPIEGRKATVHHKSKFKSFKNRNQANRLENLVALCPKQVPCGT